MDRVKSNSTRDEKIAGARIRAFYEQAYQGQAYAAASDAEEHGFYKALDAFIRRYDLSDKPCLEVGSGRGAFQDLATNYVGLDLAVSAGRFIHKPFLAASATELPFTSASFHAVWSITVLEHVPDPERALREMWRVLKPGGYLFLAPAWQCRPWAADGYPVRPYSDFDFGGKLVKASVCIRDTVWWRSFGIFPRRTLRAALHLLRPQETRLHYRELDPNFEHYWMSDSDAVNAIDPFEAYLWFVSRGAECLNYPNLLQGFFVRTGPLLLRKPEGRRWHSDRMSPAVQTLRLLASGRR